SPPRSPTCTPQEALSAPRSPTLHHSSPPSTPREARSGAIWGRMSRSQRWSEVEREAPRAATLRCAAPERPDGPAGPCGTRGPRAGMKIPMVLPGRCRGDVALAPSHDVLSERTVSARTLHGRAGKATAYGFRFRLVRGFEDRAEGDARRTCGH